LVITALETIYHFKLHVTYIRTYHNTAADDFTRKALADMLKLYNLRLVTTPPFAPFMQKGWVHRALIWEGQDYSDNQTALQLSYNRASPGPPSALLHTFEIGDACFTLTRVATILGMQATWASWKTLEHLPSGLVKRQATGPFRGGPREVLLASNAVCKDALHLIAKYCTDAHICLAAFDFPSEQQARPLTSLLDRAGITYHTYQVSGHQLGDQVKWNKVVVWVGPEASEHFPPFTDSF